MLEGYTSLLNSAFAPLWHTLNMWNIPKNNIFVCFLPNPFAFRKKMLNFAWILDTAYGCKLTLTKRFHVSGSRFQVPGFRFQVKVKVKV